MKRTEPGRSPRILLVNPWIHDFAAYDVWAAPLGLLQLGAILRLHGYTVDFVDCLDRFHPEMPAAAPSRQGRGPYAKTPLARPAGLEDVPRTYSRYGVPSDQLRRDLATRPRPDLILVTSLMTYWYPGVQETIGVLRTVFGRTPIVLGGIYATLCPEHAEARSGADRIVTGMAESKILALAAEYTGFAPAARFDPLDMDTWPHPALDLARRIPHAPILTSRGCPFSCDYCASSFLNPVRLRKSPESVVAEIHHWHTTFHVTDFAFYDDALLVDADRHIVPVLEKVLAVGIKPRFHTPNALHIRNITAPLARLMRAAGFATIRLGLETADFDHRGMDRKVDREEFFQAVGFLRDAGFAPHQVGAYLLAGLPGQDLKALEADIARVRAAGVTPILAHYTPIPHTAMWNAARRASRYDLENDPIFTNNAVWPCRKEPFSWAPLTRLKKLARGESQ